MQTHLILNVSTATLFHFRLIILPLHHPSDIRRDVQEIFRTTPHHKQVMTFSATLAGKAPKVHVPVYVVGSSGCRILTSNVSCSRSRFLSMMTHKTSFPIPYQSPSILTSPANLSMEFRMKGSNHVFLPLTLLPVPKFIHKNRLICGVLKHDTRAPGLHSAAAQKRSRNRYHDVDPVTFLLLLHTRSVCKMHYLLQLLERLGISLCDLRIIWRATDTFNHSYTTTCPQGKA